MLLTAEHNNQDQFWRWALFVKTAFYILHKNLINVITGISGEKIEIDPVVQQRVSAKFWVRQKAATYDMDSVVACDLLDAKSNSRSTFRYHMFLQLVKSIILFSILWHFYTSKWIYVYMWKQTFGARHWSKHWSVCVLSLIHICLSTRSNCICQ